MPKPILWLPFTLLTFLTGHVLADVDLVTIPRREGTQLTIYNSEDITMVREHRLLTVKPGVNRIQFTWANTLIDPTSIDFRILDHQDKVDLIDTTFPAGRNDALQWNIKSGMAGKIHVFHDIWPYMGKPAMAWGIYFDQGSNGITVENKMTPRTDRVAVTE